MKIGLKENCLSSQSPSGPKAGFHNLPQLVRIAVASGFFARRRVGFVVGLQGFEILADGCTAVVEAQLGTIRNNLPAAERLGFFSPALYGFFFRSTPLMAA